MARYPDVCALIVTYRYDYSALAELLTMLHRSLGRIVLIDNNPLPDAAQAQTLQKQFSSCTVILNYANLGLSKALNQGIQYALNQGFSWLLLFDQDSRPHPAMLERLLALRTLATDESQRIAALGPSIHDSRMQKPLPFVQFQYGKVQKIWPDSRRHQLIETDMLITSGCLISAQTLRKIGLMDERLFIDNIDMEWCFRAKAQNCRLIGVSDAVLYHRLGDHIHYHPKLGKSVIIHSPERQYHIMRNRLLLYRRDYVPLSWKLADFPRFLFKLFYFSLFVKPRWENLSQIFRGMRDGILNK